MTPAVVTFLGGAALATFLFTQNQPWGAVSILTLASLVALSLIGRKNRP